MRKVTQVAVCTQKVLNEVARQAGYVSGFVQRESKLSADKFVQTVVFGWLANASASLNELTQTAAARGVEISPQGLDKRFNEAAADCLRMVLAKAISNLITADCGAVGLLKKFTQVWLYDSSIVRLPPYLITHWLGCRGSAVKMDVGLDLLSGMLMGPYLRDARFHDSRSVVQHSSLPTAALRLADLGYFDTRLFFQLNEEGVYWISRFHPKVNLYADKSYDLISFLRKQKKKRIDTLVPIGEQLLNCRLLAVKLKDKSMIKKRQKRSRKKSANNGRKENRKLLALAGWRVYITNAPRQLLTLEEVLVLARARWQIELLFKLWKSHGQIDQWRSDKPWRILCEFYAKLLGMLIQHWILIVSCWHYPDRSLFKAAQTLRKFAFYLAIFLNCLSQLVSVLNRIIDIVKSCCRIKKRKKAPSCFQLLLNEALG